MWIWSDSDGCESDVSSVTVVSKVSVELVEKKPEDFDTGVSMVYPDTHLEYTIE